MQRYINTKCVRLRVFMCIASLVFATILNIGCSNDTSPSESADTGSNADGNETGIDSASSTYNYSGDSVSDIPTETEVDTSVDSATDTGGENINDTGSVVDTNSTGDTDSAGDTNGSSDTYGDSDAESDTPDTTSEEDSETAEPQSGDLLLLLQAGGTGNERPLAVDVSADDTVWIAGTFEEDATFGAGEITETTLHSPSDVPSLFVAGYSPDGHSLFASAGICTRSCLVSAIDTTQDGSLWMTGRFMGEVTFGGGEPGETTLVGTRDHYSLFLVQYGADGALTFAKRLVNAVDAHEWTQHTGDALVATPDGGVWVGMTIFGSVVFDESSPESSTFDFESYEMSIFRFHADGSTGAVIRVSTTDRISARDIDVSADGSVWVTGSFSMEAVFGTGEPKETTLASDNPNTAIPDDSDTIFVARYNEDGTLICATQAGATGSTSADSGEGIAVTDDGGAWVTGDVYGQAVFGGGEAGEVVLPHSDHSDIFIARYNADCTLVTAKWAGGGSYCLANGIVSSAENDVWITGSIMDYATFGVDELNESEAISASGESMLYLAKYHADAGLEFLRIPAAVSHSTSAGFGISRSDNAVWMTGIFNGTLLFEENTGEQLTVETNTDGTDIFLAKFQL